MQIVVDMDGGAYILADLMALMGHKPGAVLDITMDGDRLIVSVPRALVEQAPEAVELPPLPKG